MSKIIIYTDGASKGNPGRGGWGALIADVKEVVELGGAEAHTTNNRMELRAGSEALDYAKMFDAAEITLYTDSAYVINGATMWGNGWNARGWMTKDKKPVLNRDMWEPLLALVESFAGRIRWENVGGHIGVAGNERVDAIADAFAFGQHTDLYAGPRESYKIDVTDLSFDEEKKKARGESRDRSKQKAYSYVSAVDGKIEVHKTWAECEARVRGKKARFKKALSAVDETAIIRDFRAS